MIDFKNIFHLNESRVFNKWRLPFVKNYSKNRIFLRFYLDYDPLWQKHVGSEGDVGSDVSPG